MTDVIKFPGSDMAARRAMATGFFVEPPAHTHAVQFYEGEEDLFETVGRFLAMGLESGERLLVIATREHREAFADKLRPCGGDAAAASGQLVLLDARQTLSKFMVGGMPDAEFFHQAIGRALAVAQNGEPHAPVRAYGEMVDLLWRDGNSRAAIRLEELWNDASKLHSFSLLCAYVMGNFYREGDSDKFMEVCRLHSHVIPSERLMQNDDPAARMRELSLLQEHAHSLENEIHHRRELEGALREALREQCRAEDELRASLEREKSARHRAEASDKFKQLFLGVLGHELRNPLNTVLTTAQLMKLRGELGGESAKRVERIARSGERMQRMIEQLLDVTRARHNGGIPVKLSEQKCDLVPLVSGIVEELRLVHAGRQIDVHVDGDCSARVDGDRFEQVISNLIGNALAYGDPQKPVSVRLTKEREDAAINVHNWGPPIDPAFVPQLFNPFERGRNPESRSQGLGLGLYISERIVSGHGGEIEVESSSEAGTRFRVRLPERQTNQEARATTAGRAEQPHLVRQ